MHHEQHQQQPHDVNRPPPRRNVTTRHVARVRDGLSDRDREILATLASVRVATGAQLDDLHFDGLAERSRSRRRRDVMARLTKHRLVTRLARSVGGARAGSTGFIYTLDVAGQRLFPHLGRARRPITPSWPFLAHALDVTDLMVRLVVAEREGRLHLLRFAAEPACWLAIPGDQPLKPDATAAVELGVWRDHLAFEVDRGTESLPVIERQLRRYEHAWRLGITAADATVFPRVLWRVEDDDRGVAIASVIERSRHPELFSVHRADDIVAAIIAGPEGPA